jgi:hypothetical protein
MNPGIKAPECQRYHGSPCAQWRLHDDGIQTVHSSGILFDHSQGFTILVCFRSWRILDLSVAMAYAMLTVYGKKNRAISAAAAFLRGFNSVCPLTDAERSHLVLLVVVRLACSATLGAYSHHQNPENEYLLLHAAPAWDTIELIWGTDPVKRAKMTELLDGIFDQACSATVDPDVSVIDCSDLAFPDPSVGDPFSDIRASCKPMKRAS